MNKALQSIHSPRLRNQRGVAIILVALLMFVFLGVAALAIDLSTLYVAGNELQNAADAGALAGARFLYNVNGTVNAGANQIAYDAATINEALSINGATGVDVNWTGGNTGDVQRGHWSFGFGSLPRGFYPNDNTAPVNLWDVTSAELDGNVNFINAVRTITRREATPAASFFARIFGHESFELSKEAVAYIGFAGDLGPGEVDQPIGICAQSILFDGVYNCNVGRMLNSGSNVATSNTGGWTNFSQPCETANPTSLRPLICSGGNPEGVTFGEGIGAVNGVQDNIFRDLESCWGIAADSNGDGIPDTTWELTLPVIDCPSNAVSNCADLIGAVTLKVVWVQRDNPGYDDAPVEMSDPETGVNWPTPEDLAMLVEELEPYFEDNNTSFPADFPEGATVGSVFYAAAGDQNKVKEDKGKVRWASFVRSFNLKNVGPEASAPYATFALKSIYFLPSCKAHEPRGNTGGENFGILAEIPKLVL